MSGRKGGYEARSVSWVAALFLALGCGGRSLEDQQPSAAPSDSAAAGSTPPEVNHLQGARFATYGASGIGIALYDQPISPSSVPDTTIEGAWHMDACDALAFDGARNVYALCYQVGPSEPTGRIVVFDATAAGADAPSRVITGSNTTIEGYATGLAVDRAGSAYVVADGYCTAPPCDGMVSIFAPGAAGNVAPARVIQGPHTGLDLPVSVAVDAAGLIYVGNAEGGPILVFAADAHDDAPPIRKIGDRMIVDALGLAVDQGGTVFVADVAVNDVLIYGPDAGEGPPSRVIVGPSTRLQNLMGIATDIAGRILVSQDNPTDGSGSIAIFPATASGNTPSVVLQNVSGAGIAVAP